MNPSPHQARLAKKHGESWDTVIAGFDSAPLA